MNHEQQSAIDSQTSNETPMKTMTMSWAMAWTMLALCGAAVATWRSQRSGVGGRRP